MRRPLIIGIAGGSGSGKSTVANKIINSIKGIESVIINEDDYHKKNSKLSFEEKKAINYDHPDSFEHELLASHLKELLIGNSVEIPKFDFNIYDRLEECEKIDAKDVIIVEGLFILYDKRVRDLLDIKVYVDTDADVRLIRRILRDTRERARELDSIILQYMTSTRSSHINFVEPSKKFADIIIPEGGDNKVAIDILSSTIKSRLGEI